MKLPSIRELLRTSARTFLRFPAVLIDAILGTAAALVLINHEGPPEPSNLFRILFSAILGIPLFTGIALTGEARGWSRGVSAGATAAGCLLLAVYGATVPANLPGAPELHLIRLVLTAAGLHLFVAAAPFFRNGELTWFWRYNISLCLRFIVTVLFSMVLFAGLAFALAALDNLFGMTVREIRFFQLWVLVAGVFATWFFLAGVPDDLRGQDDPTGFRKGLKTFVQFILLPLLTVYLVILYAYAVKILVDWSWPRGWVSGLILGYAATGFLVLLLMYPMKDRQDSPWIRLTWRWFVVSMVPLVFMLLMAMWRRISEYGVTEDRYFGAVLGLWLAVTVAYFIASSRKNISVIPASLSILALLAGFGPWSAFDVSETSQVARLGRLLETHSMLDGGKVRPPRDSVSTRDRAQISSIVGYLYAIHGYQRIQPWFTEDLSADETGAGGRGRSPGAVTRMMGIEPAARSVVPEAGRFILSADRKSVADIGAFDRILPAQSIDRTRLTGGSADGEVAYTVDPDLETMTVILRGGEGTTDSVTLRLGPMVESLLREYGGGDIAEIPVERMSAKAWDDGAGAKIILRRIRLTRGEGGVTFTGYEADILYTVPGTP